MNYQLLVIFCVLIFSTSSCLMTHGEIEKQQKKQKLTLVLSQPSVKKPLPKKVALKNNSSELREVPKVTSSISHIPISSSTKHTVVLQDIQQELRSLRGQVELLNQKQKQQSLALQSLSDTVLSIRKKQKLTSHKVINVSLEDSLLNTADELFKIKQWKQAIVYYDKYRKTHKKHPKYRRATLQIGYCFQKLSMHKEAKVFFKEIVEHFPKSAEAIQARKELSTQVL